MSDEWHLSPARTIVGRIAVPGDKSIGHRAIMLAGLAEGESRVEGLSSGQDVASTVRVMGGLGVELELADRQDGPSLSVRGRGLASLRAPTRRLDCGNSGTTMRLVAGIAAGQNFPTVLGGDRSLRSRPMARIVEPLRVMGAQVETREGDRAPLRIHGGRLRGLTHRPPVASAQVKSCILLAGLFAEGQTRVVERGPTRDHTERMLAAMGADVRAEGADIVVTPGSPLTPLRGRIPGDVSSAAYLVAAATLLAGSRLHVQRVGTNPGRVVILDLLAAWGAELEIGDETTLLGEPAADIGIRGVGPRLRGGRVAREDVPALIDELPLLGLMAPFTRDGIEVRGAAELRVKESDRIATTCAAVRALGGEVEEYPDGFAVAGGGGLAGGTVEAHGDHRIALAAAAVSVACAGEVHVRGAGAAAVSFPGFAPLLASLVRR